MSLRILGQVRLGRGEMGQAEAALRHSLQILGELNSDYEAARTKLSLARLGVERHLAEPAERRQTLAAETAAWLEQARHTFEKLGAAADLAEAHALQTRLERGR